MKWSRKFLYFFIGSFFILVLVGGYLGFVPFISTAFNADKPRDLGVKVDDATASAVLSNEIIAPQVSTSSSTSPWEENTLTSISLSSERVSSLVQNWKKETNPIAEDFQMKIGKNDVVEISGIVSRSKLSHMISSSNAPELLAYLNILSFLPEKAPFYIKGSASVLNNQVTLTLDELQIGRAPIPFSESLTRALENKIESGISGTKIEFLNFHEGVLNLKGEWHPAS